MHIPSRSSDTYVSGSELPIIRDWYGIEGPSYRIPERADTWIDLVWLAQHTLVEGQSITILDLDTLYHIYLLIPVKKKYRLPLTKRGEYWKGDIFQNSKNLGGAVLRVRLYNYPQ